MKTLFARLVLLVCFLLRLVFIAALVGTFISLLWFGCIAPALASTFIQWSEIALLVLVASLVSAALMGGIWCGLTLYCWAKNVVKP